MSTTTASGAQSRLDFTMMYAAHDAFRRDLARLVAAADGRTGDLRAFRAGWATFTYYLTVHHTSEDNVLWPPVRRQAGSDPERLALLESMTAEHSALDPLLEAIDSKLKSGGTARLPADMEELSKVLTAHLDHEETAGLPLVDAVLSKEDWERFGEDQRRQVGTKGAATFFPWLLDGMPESSERKVLALVPPPIRLLYRKAWRPKYQKQSPWA